MKKTSLVLASMMFAGLAMANQEQPNWEFGCKLDAQKAATEEQAKVTVENVKPEQENTWTFEARELPLVSMR
ncbi:hypothetical protein JX580_00775 [Thiomicrospira microaerophila]|uniref:hypothetical protein n=1 Tax=Thiomicrospira microaerophila TaxID=406020 RepID=UPI00200E7666|nr:hypothetical protein [Thiomicrospira microaerophila]UQB42483.1 hypothetical protein JX580_00775 [Thiomicrospira microaerophila]